MPFTIIKNVRKGKNDKVFKLFRTNGRNDSAMKTDFASRLQSTFPAHRHHRHIANVRLLQFKLLSRLAVLALERLHFFCSYEYVGTL